MSKCRVDSRISSPSKSRAFAGLDIRIYVRTMGDNRRYGFQQVDPPMNDLLTRPKPISLSPSELGTDPARVPEVPNPVDIIAWVRYPETAVRVRARAVAWTDRAVWIEFTTHAGATHRAWVWASAVSRE